MLTEFLRVYLVASLLIGGVQLINRKEVVCRALVALFVCLQVMMTAVVVGNSGATVATFFCFDGLATLLTIVVTIVTMAAFCHSRRYIEEGEKGQDDVVRAQYYGAMTVLTMALTMAGLSAHLAMTWVFIEVTTLCASALIFYRRNSGSIEATWKYVFACSISLVLVYVGILLTSVSMGENVEAGLSFEVLNEKAEELDPFWLKMAFAFILVGYTAKMGLVPMFTAGIDAKDKAPTPAAALLSSIVMNGGFVGFYRFYAVVSHTSAAEWARMVVLITGIVSIFVATVYLVRVYNIKRLFAYSSVEHMGVIMLGVAAGGVGLYAAVLHLVLHSFAKSAVFMHVGQLYRVYGTKMLTRMGRYMKRSGVGATIVILGLLSVTAMPPSGLFMTEMTIYKALIDAEMWVAIVVSMILLCVIVWAISRDIFSLLFLPSQEPEVRKEPEVKFPFVEGAWQFVLLILSMWWGLWTPEFIAELVREAVALV